MGGEGRVDGFGFLAQEADEHSFAPLAIGASQQAFQLLLPEEVAQAHDLGFAQGDSAQLLAGGVPVVGSDGLDEPFAPAVDEEVVQDAVDQVAPLQGGLFGVRVGQGGDVQQAVGEELERTEPIGLQLSDGEGVAPAQAGLYRGEDAWMLEDAFVRAGTVGPGALCGDFDSVEQAAQGRRQRGMAQPLTQQIGGAQGRSRCRRLVQAAADDRVQRGPGVDCFALFFGPGWLGTIEQLFDLLDEGGGGECGVSLALWKKQGKGAARRGYGPVEEQAVGGDGAVHILQSESAADAVFEEDIGCGKPGQFAFDQAADEEVIAGMTGSLLQPGHLDSPGRIRDDVGAGQAGAQQVGQRAQRQALLVQGRGQQAQLVEKVAEGLEGAGIPADLARIGAGRRQIFGETEPAEEMEQALAQSFGGQRAFEGRQQGEQRADSGAELAQALPFLLEFGRPLPRVVDLVGQYAVGRIFDLALQIGDAAIQGLQPAGAARAYLQGAGPGIQVGGWERDLLVGEGEGEADPGETEQTQEGGTGIAFEHGIEDGQERGDHRDAQERLTPGQVEGQSIAREHFFDEWGVLIGIAEADADLA